MHIPRRNDTGTLQRIPAMVNDQWNFLLFPIWDRMIHLVICFGGRLNEPVLAAAARSACEAEPLTTMRFCEGETPFFSSSPDFRDETYACIRSDNPDATLRQILAEPLNPLTGPQARIRLIRSDHDRLCISINHTISDAYGVKSFGSRIARVYRALSSSVPFSSEGSSLDRSMTSVLRLFSPAERETAQARYGEQLSSWSLPMQSRRTGDPGYTGIRLRPGVLESLKVKARLSGATVNDVLLSALTLALAEVVPELRRSALPVLTSIDLRRYLSPDSLPSLANLSVAFDVPVMAGPGESLSPVVRQVHSVMNERKEGHAGIGSAERLCRDFAGGYGPVKQHLLDVAREARDGRREKNPFFSNLGIIPESVLSYGDCAVEEAWMLPPVEYPPGFGLAASTCRGSLCLASGHCREALPENEVRNILYRMAKIIADW